jgi:hypothetical protein
MKQNVHVKFHSKALLEELESRQLFSGGIEGILADNNEPKTDPGSTEAFISLQDENLASLYPPAMLKVTAGFCIKNKPLPKWLENIVLSLPQKWTQYKHYPGKSS